MTITTMDNYHQLNKYEVVEAIPPRFFVWNIGDNMGRDDYIPLCERKYPWAKPEDMEYYHINPYTLKAIRLPAEEVAILRKAATYGSISKEKALNISRRKVENDWDALVVGYAKKALPIFERITM